MLAAAVLPVGASEGGKPGIAWMDDFGTAMEKAGKENRPLLVDFYTDWSLYCGKLEKETMSDSRIVRLSKDFVCVRLDAEVHKGVAARYTPEGFPTIILATPTGDELLRVSGFRDADGFHKVLKAVHDRAPQMTEDLARIKKDSGDFAAREDLGTIYLDLGLADPAVEHLRAAAKAAPRVPAQPGRESDAQGWVIQVTALRDRAAALAIVSRLTERNYPAFLLEPGPGAPAPVYRVRVGRYTDRAEAERVSRRLEREEQFKPLITR